MPKFQFSPQTIEDVSKILNIGNGSDFETALQALAADVEAQQNKGKRRWHHLKRGSNYTEQYRAHLQVATKPPVEDDMMVVYTDDETGRVCTREAGEFEDGRFIEILQAEVIFDKNVEKKEVGVTFDPDFSPSHPTNIAAAKAFGVSYSEKKKAYVDSEGFLIFDQFGQRL